MIKRFSRGNFKQLYQETVGTDLTNRNVTLNEEQKNKDLPYPQVTELKFKLFDSPGKFSPTTINTKFFADIKALFIVFDLTDEESFKGIQNYVSMSKTFFEICKKNKLEEGHEILKQPELFKDLPILVIGNKSDLTDQRKVLNAKIEECIQNLKNLFSLTKLTYHEISVKDNKGIEKLFQESIFYYFKRNFQPIAYKGKIQIENEEEVNISNNENSDKELELNKNNSLNNSYDSNNKNGDSQNDLFLDIKEVKKKKKKRPSMDKSVVIFHQMIDKIKKQFYNEIISIKEENKKEIENLKNLMENKSKEFEEAIKIKNKEIEILKEQINNINKETILKFKIEDKKFKNEIIINTKGEKRMSEVIGTVYELCPYLSNLKVKYFCLEGNKNNKIDEMKTVNENKLVNGSIISVIV